MTDELIIKRLKESEQIELAKAVFYAREQYALGSECMLRGSRNEKILLQAYEHFTNIFIALNPFESRKEVQALIGQALERKATVCVELAEIAKPALYDLLARDFFLLAISYLRHVTEFIPLLGNLYLAACLACFNLNDLATAKKCLTEGVASLPKKDDTETNEMRNSFKECSQQYDLLVSNIYPRPNCRVR